MQDEFAAEDFGVVAIALDEHVDVVRPLTENITFPVLIDREHLITELLAISNVPTVLWVDESTPATNVIARPPLPPVHNSCRATGWRADTPRNTRA